MRVEAKKVEVRATVPGAWPVIGDFWGLWHPLVATISREGQVRAFTVKGESTVYRERLVWRSDSDQVLDYEMVEGIAGCTSYRARVEVSEADAVTWTAEIEGPRAAAIAEGTEAIFRAGLEALALRRRQVDRLSILETGGQGRTAALFLHGIGGAKENWAAELNALRPIMPAAAMDLRGYGGSHLGPRQSTVEDHCADILRVKAALQADRLLLVGLSFGAWLATSFALRHPEALKGLVLMGGCTGMSEAPPEEREAFRLSREVPLSQGLTPADFAPKVVEVIAGPQAPEAARQKLLASMQAIPAATYRDALTLFTHPPERFDLARLTLPVLMMTGAQDRLAPPQEIRAVSRRFPDAAFEVIPAAGHVCNLEAPGPVARHLQAFARRL